MSWFNLQWLFAVPIVYLTLGWQYCLFLLIPIEAGVFLIKNARWIASMTPSEPSASLTFSQSLAFTGKRFGAPLVWIAWCFLVALLGLAVKVIMRDAKVGSILIGICVSLGVLFVTATLVAMRMQRDGPDLPRSMK